MCQVSSGALTALAISSASTDLPVPGSPFTSKRTLQDDGGIDGDRQILGRHIRFGAVETRHSAFLTRSPSTLMSVRSAFRQPACIG